jgi:branched-subunit amino acid permease
VYVIVVLEIGRVQKIIVKTVMDEVLYSLPVDDISLKWLFSHLVVMIMTFQNR